MPNLTTTKQLYRSLLKHYALTHSLTKTTQLHAQLLTSGHLSSAHLRSCLATTYAHCGHSNALKLFDKLAHRTPFLYNNILKMHVNSAAYLDAIKLFVQMLHLGDCYPDNYTYPFVFKACGALSWLEFGRVVHGHALVSNFGSEMYVVNALVAMYMNCGEKGAARKVFDGMRERSVVSWNSMISGYFLNGCARDALVVFNEMVQLGVEIDHASVVCVLPACGYLKELEMGRKVHAFVDAKGLGKEIAVRNVLVDMYARCGSVDEARLVFDKMDQRDVVSWTSMINGYILNGDVRNALVLCREMQVEGLMPNKVTIALLLSACADLNYVKDGRCLHGWVIRRTLDSEIIVETSLIDMYAKCKRVDLSFVAFRRTSRKRTVPWNAVLAGCVHNGLGTGAIGLFKQMLSEGVQPDDATFSSFLPAYAILTDLQPAKSMHCYLFKSGFLSDIEVATCMIDIYSKGGNLSYAYEIFNAIPIRYKDIYVWSVIIAGYGTHGHGETAVSLFRKMIQSGVKPNKVTFTSVLHACSHAGLVDEGLCLFKYMLNNHQTSPHDDHYTCIVDMLGRAGRLNEAYDLIRTMPFLPSHAVWGALLGACVIHENVELGEIAAQWLFEHEPEDTGNYVLLGKLYAAVGRWKDAESVRHMMNDIGLRKAPAHSLVDVRN